MLITTTHVFDVQNKELKIARNYKAEAGIDFHLGKMRMGVTAYLERLRMDIL